MNAVKITDLPKASDFNGLVAYGVDTIKDESVQIPLEFVKQGVDRAIAAAEAAENVVDQINEKMAMLQKQESKITELISLSEAKIK